eukprot:2970932-Rhodomonas_salina.1
MPGTGIPYGAMQYPILTQRVVPCDICRSKRRGGKAAEYRGVGRGSRSSRSVPSRNRVQRSRYKSSLASQRCPIAMSGTDLSWYSDVPGTRGPGGTALAYAATLCPVLT